MKNTYEVLDQNGQVFWRIALSGCSSVWDALIVELSEPPIEIPDFQDESEALLLNTIERWCIINGLKIRPDLTLTMGGGTKYDDYYRINDERVFLCFKWLVVAKVFRRKSKRTRIENFEVHSQDREGATDQAGRHFKGASIREIVSLTPCGFGLCYYKDRPGFPNIEPDVISRLPMPENL